MLDSPYVWAVLIALVLIILRLSRAFASLALAGLIALALGHLGWLPLSLSL